MPSSIRDCIQGRHFLIHQPTMFADPASDAGQDRSWKIVAGRSATSAVVFAVRPWLSRKLRREFWERRPPDACRTCERAALARCLGIAKLKIMGQSRLGLDMACLQHTRLRTSIRNRVHIRIRIRLRMQLTKGSCDGACDHSCTYPRSCCVIEPTHALEVSPSGRRCIAVKTTRSTYLCTAK